MITLRAATPADIELLKKWDEYPHVRESGIEDWDWDTDLHQHSPHVQHYISMLDDRPIGYLCILDPALEESHYWGEVSEHLRAIDIWIGEPDCLNRGYGTEIMQLAFKLCFEKQSANGILIDPLTSNLKAQRFYKRLGFKFQEHRTFSQDHCSVYFLSRADWDNKN